MDAETGFSQNGFRDYWSTFGRYLESDPTGLAAGLNTYAYADGNPLKNIDQTGLDIRIYQVHGFHEAIAVDTGQGQTTFGLGPAWDWAPVSPGRIDEGEQPYSNISGGELVSSYPLTPSQGDAIAQWLRQVANNPPVYNVLGLLPGMNCHQFANMVASVATSGGITLPSSSPIDVNLF
jgi:uncharacterized protein RhaS with RHS repeats